MDSRVGLGIRRDILDVAPYPEACPAAREGCNQPVGGSLPAIGQDVVDQAERACFLDFASSMDVGLNERIGD